MSALSYCVPGLILLIVELLLHCCAALAAQAPALAGAYADSLRAHADAIGRVGRLGVIVGAFAVIGAPMRGFVPSLALHPMAFVAGGTAGGTGVIWAIERLRRRP